MKKLLAIFMLCFAVFAANAQVFLLQESFEASDIPSGWTIIDNDGDGNNWYVLYGQGDDPEGMAHTGIGHITSASWQSSAFTPDNYLITGGIEIPANANQPTLSWWAKGQDPDWAAEHYAVYISTTGQTIADFTAAAVYEGEPTGEYVQHTVDLSTYAGQTIYVAFRHYNITDMFRLNLDDIEIYTTPTEPTLSVAPTTIDFGTIFVGSTSENTATVTAFNLTADITVTTTAPFAVSLDGETFATTVSMPAAGGTLYVQYAPTAVDTDNGTVTLTNGDLTATITVAGNGFECATVTDFPYETNFSNTAMNDCWTIEDANNDNKTFTIVPGSSYAYYSYNTTSNADDWLISPTFTLTGNEYLTFDYRAASSSWAEKFEVAVIQGTTRTIVVPEITVTNSSFQALDIVDLSAYTGDYQIGIHCISDTNRYNFYVTNFKVAEAIPSLTLSEEDIDFGTVIVNETADEEVLVSTMLVTDAVEVSTAAPFTVSLDGTTFAATATIPATTDMANTTIVYVRFAPTAAEEYAGTVIFTAGELVDTVLVAGNGFECTTVTEFPYQTDFSNEAMNLCWSVENANNDSYEWTFSTSYAYASMHWNSSMAADDWLISPTFTLTGNEYVKFDYKTGNSWDEKFEVAIIQGETRTVIVPEMTVCTSEYVTLDPAVLNAYTGDYQIGIHCTSDADKYYLYVSNFVVESIDSLDSALTVHPEAIDFGSLIYTEGMTATETATVTAIKIHNLTASAEAPYTLSLDGTTFAASVTIPDEDPVANTATLYVQFAPTAAGSFPGVVTLTNGTTTATINLTASVADCSTAETLPFVEDFEDALSDCWQNIDNDGDGYTWFAASSFFQDPTANAHNSNDAYCSASYDNPTYTALTPENWLITPALVIPADTTAYISWWDAAQDGNYPAEYYELMVSTTGFNLSDFTSIWNITLSSNTWTERTVDLTEYAGQTIYLAFVHKNCTDQFVMKIDDINVAVGTHETVGIEEETAANAVSIYPNPASTMLNVHAENFDNVQIINFLGQVVYSANVTENDFQINVSNLSNGVYFIRLNGENTITKKFVKK